MESHTVDQIYSVTPDDVERDNDADVWEWYNLVVQEADCQMLTDIANADEVVVRMNGRQYYKDVKLSSTQIEAFKNTLYAYWGSGGRICK